MKKIFSKAVVLLLTLVLVLVVGGQAYARVYSQFYLTRHSTTNNWKTEPYHSLTSTQQAVYGGDVGVYFQSNNVGLSSSFVRSMSRYAHVQLWEYDTTFLNADEHARSYKIRFAMVNGYYRPHLAITTYTNSKQVEADPVVELYIKFKVDKVNGDTSSYVPHGLIKYKFWAN